MHMSIIDNVHRKFTNVIPVTDWEVSTESGWVDITHFNVTVEYQVWRITTETGRILEGADTHILIDYEGDPVFIKDSLDCGIKTVSGIERVVSVEQLDYQVPMYDITVNSPDHTYYTNGMLSHNTTVASGYLLWYGMFNEDSTILITSNKYDGAQEIMLRIRYAYECVPDHIRAGVKEYNKRSMSFDNGSRIVATTTTENTGRGMSLSLVYCLGGENTVTVRDKVTGEVKNIALADLYKDLEKS